MRQTTAEAFGGLTDDQIANAYGAFGLYGAGDTGSGQHIAIFELEPFDNERPPDVRHVLLRRDARPPRCSAALHVVERGRRAGRRVRASASRFSTSRTSPRSRPGANIDVYQAPNTTFGAARRVRADRQRRRRPGRDHELGALRAGACSRARPASSRPRTSIFQQAAAQGQTIFSASGDQGSNDCNAFRDAAPVDPVLSVDDPSSQPYVVAAGGTTIDNATQTRVEHVWNDGAIWGAGGGGISESWPMPNWQLDSLVPGGATSTSNQDSVTAAQTFEGHGLLPLRQLPVRTRRPAASFPTSARTPTSSRGGITVFSDSADGGWNTNGGTSSAAPLWAAMLADVNASSTCQNNPATQDGVGFLSPLLYSVASNPTAYAASFNDIKLGNNDPYGDSNLFQATTGFDMATGLGSPQLTAPGGGAGLAFYLCNQAPAATRPTVTQLAPATGFTSDPSTSVTITGSHFQDNSNPVVGVQVGDYQVPSADFNVSDASHITATFPAAAKVIPPNDQTNGAGRVQVTVTLQDGETSAVNINSWFTYVADNGSSQPRPTVTSVLSYAGPEAGGNTVDVYGSGFSGATDVTFGGVSAGAANFEVNVSGTSISVKVPAFEDGTTTCDQDGSSFSASENSTNDICQTEVVVTDSERLERHVDDPPAVRGPINIADNGVIITPPGDEAFAGCHRVRLRAESDDHVDLHERRRGRPRSPARRAARSSRSPARASASRRSTGSTSAARPRCSRNWTRSRRSSA